MDDFLKDPVVSISALATLAFVLGAAIPFGPEPDNSSLLRNCSLTGVHIINEDTVIVCKVLKVNRTETPVQDNKKPEVTL